MMHARHSPFGAYRASGAYSNPEAESRRMAFHAAFRRMKKGPVIEEEGPKSYAYDTAPKTLEQRSAEHEENVAQEGRYRAARARIAEITARRRAKEAAAAAARTARTARTRQ